MGTLPSRWIPVQYRLITWSAWRKDGRHSRRWFKWYVDVFGLKTQLVEIQQNSDRDNTALWLLKMISPSSRENKRLLMTCSNWYIHAVHSRQIAWKMAANILCVCVCVYVCAYKHTHTHTEGMSYATCQNVCGFLVTIDDSMFIQSQWMWKFRNIFPINTTLRPDQVWRSCSSIPNKPNSSFLWLLQTSHCQMPAYWCF